ncbi:hypothetical protein Tsubulata_007865 [Turnera subulata]|uniref:Uncharacterized protein n=1 Tax=Turnera subulata TaxID=218843 RepID=A0A9Q0JNS4_9ROSI|nr:hypothetical protein Tsubulata_007865 [Turnera subulata]
MDDQEFRRLLDLFPVVRPRDYHIELDPSKQSTSRSVPEKTQAAKKWKDACEEGDPKPEENKAIDGNVTFWEKLKSAAERKMGAEEAKRFCQAFQQVHRKLVYEELSLDAARSFINSSKGCGQ